MTTANPDLEKARAMVRELIERNAGALLAEQRRESFEKEAARLLADLNSPGQTPRLMGIAHVHYLDLYDAKDIDPGNPSIEWRCEVLIRHSNANPAAFEALKRKTCAMLRSGEPLPSNLARWIAGVLEGSIKSPSRKRQDTKPALKDLVVLALCRMELEFNITPTRSDPPAKMKNTLCGCDILCQELEAVGVFSSYGAISQIWKRAKKYREVVKGIILGFLAR